MKKILLLCATLLVFAAGARGQEWIATTQSDMLTMDMLHKQGVKGYIFGPRTIDKELTKYIESNFK